MAYKVLLLNGSPHAKGCTARALEEMIRTLNEEGVETTLLQIGGEDVRGCISCGFCRRNGRCVFDDKVNEAAAALNAAIAALVRVPAEDADVYELVTEAPEDWSGTYLFAVNVEGTTYVFNGKEEVNGHVVTTVTDNKITFIEGMEPVVIAPMEGGWSLHVTNGYMYGVSGSNLLKFDAEPKLATLEFGENNQVTITSDTTIFRFNTASNQLRFRFYKPTSGTNYPLMQLYKKVG